MESDSRHGRYISDVPCGLTEGRERPIFFGGQHGQNTLHPNMLHLTGVGKTLAVRAAHNTNALAQ